MKEWNDNFDREILTADELQVSNLRVSIISELIKARNNQKISQRELERMSGIRQPIISRLESGATDPMLDTVLKLLASLGMTLEVVPMKRVG
ncbi:MAG: helix-turn-helix domain-containing protein [Deferribacteraceae bacterium]|jgi:predicted transcriptional regulator|nr:helix-turn-helix domain-containing protein [Deferribacteraceae bacterium]